MNNITANDYLLASGILFTVGFSGVLLRRNIITILMSLELMLNASNLSLIAFSRNYMGADHFPDCKGQILVFFIITVAAAEVALGLAIIVSLFRLKKTIHIDDLQSLKF